MEKSFYKSRLRSKGQITVPHEIRNMLGADEGDEVIFYADEQGRIIISRSQVIPPDQAWFWSERWQRNEQEAQHDLQTGRVLSYKTVKEALVALDELTADSDADN